MNTPIDRIGSPDAAQPGEIVKPVDRSGKEKNDQGFAKALKEKMREELEDEKKKKQEDRLDLINESEMDDENENQTDIVDESQLSSENDKEDDEPSTSEHIDVKA